MATKEQYEFFKSLYDEENSRYSVLENRAKLYVTIIALYLGAIAFKISDLLALSQHLKMPLLAFILVILIFLAALLAAILAIQVRTYEAVCNPKEVVLGFGEQPQSNEDFFDHRIADFTVATVRNRDVNNRVATTLQVAAWLLFVGVLVHIGTFIVWLRA